MHTGIPIRKIYKSDGNMWRLNLPKDLATQVGIGLGTVVTVSMTTGGGLLIMPVQVRAMVALDPEAQP